MGDFFKLLSFKNRHHTIFYSLGHIGNYIFKFHGGISATFEDIDQCEANLKKLFFTAHRGRTLLVYLVILRYFNIAFPLGYYI